ncbi:unnamed protein product [Microthlaspi erraticum]|uniref:Uncharacterized protein n=1 Tax=Microthlaspi erraticum TaxID=1685480 RepID=A0A6D2L065_9BRAS|nr:unnamed protein product [Microthlaspi erraticum]CAA7053507.1 unnamed protein product [Microthlaspi erraticum]
MRVNISLTLDLELFLQGQLVKFVEFDETLSGVFLVTMIAQKEEPSEIQIKDKFMIQSVLADLGVTDKEVTDEMFYDGGWRQVEQTILKATYDFSSTSSCKCL